MEQLCVSRAFSIRLIMVTCLMLQSTSEAEPGSDAPTNEGGGIHLDLNEGAVMGNYEAGQTQLMNIQRDSQHPRYGKCWTNALQVVSAGCKRLTDDEQSRMALTLANCHLSKAGFETYPCDDSMDMKECLNPMKDSSIAFNAYTEFFTHTQDICFFLQSQVWHEHTEETVEKLAQSSEDVVEQLEVSGRLQESMIQQQNQSLMNQERILAQEAQLREALKTSTNSIQEVFAEMRSSTLEQKALFAETFDRVAQVQRLMLGEFTWFNSVTYFVVIVVLAYMVTSTPRTAGARFGLFLLLLLNWVMEWLLFRITDPDDQTLYHARTWRCRKTFCLVGFLYLVYRACRYQDYNQINHNILLQIQKELQGRALNPGPQKQVSAGTPQGLIRGTNVPLLSIVSPKQTPAIQYRHSHRNVNLSQSKLSVTEFTSDGSGDERDVTFNPENLASSESRDSSSSEHSFLTADSASRRASTAEAAAPKTPHNVGTASASHESGSVDSGSTAKRKRGRPKGSKNKSFNKQSPILTGQYQSPYNLRQRTPHQSPNPVLDLETTLMFASHVKNMASRHFVIERMRETPTSGGGSRRGRSPAKSRASPAFFSSDDEP